MMIHGLLTVVAILTTMTLPGQSAAPVCPADAAPLPPSFADWATPDPMATAATGAVPIVQAGQAVDLALLPQSSVTLATKPGREPSPGDHAGVVRLMVPNRGIYRLALSARAWVDVVRDGRVLASTAHGHGPACSGIRKIVDFDLSPGEHLIQVTASQDAKIRLLVAGE